jgi:hypothetical protein
MIYLSFNGFSSPKKTICPSWSTFHLMDSLVPKKTICPSWSTFCLMDPLISNICKIVNSLPIMNLEDEAFSICMVLYFISVLVVSPLLCSLVTCVLKLLFAMYFLWMGLYTRFSFYHELAEYPFLILSLIFIFFFLFFLLCVAFFFLAV